MNTTGKRKNTSGIFDDFDLSDLKTNDSFGSFHSSRKAVKTEDSNTTSKLDSIDNKISVSSLRSKGFVKSKDFRTFSSNHTKRNTSFNSPIITNGFKRCDIFGDIDLNDIKAQSSSFTNAKNCLKSNNSRVFGDFDLSDIKLDQSFQSFQCSRKIFANIELNEVKSNVTEEVPHHQESEVNAEIANDVKEKASNCDSPKSEFDSLLTETVFNNSDLNLKRDSNVNIIQEVNQCFDDIDLSDIQFMSQSLTRFESANKALKGLTENTSKPTEDSAIVITDVNAYPSFKIEDLERKSIISNVFDDLDLNDIKFDQSLPSFRNARTACQSPAITHSPDMGCETDIDWKEMENIFDESFGDSQNFMTSSPKPKKSLRSVPICERCSQKCETKSNDGLDSSITSNDSFAECADRLIETMNLTEITKHENRTDIDNECDSKQSVNECDSPESSFSFRTDFDTFNEKSEEVINIGEELVANNNEELIGFRGFRLGSGRPIVLDEGQLNKAQDVFKDIEEWLMDEISSNRLVIKDSDEDLYCYSQHFIANGTNIEQSVRTVTEMSSSTQS